MAETSGGTESAECEVCGTSFDPTKAGGWCTNPECGKWQHPDYRQEATDQVDKTPEPEPEPEQHSEPTSTRDEPVEPDEIGGQPGEIGQEMKECPDCGTEVSADVNFCTHCRYDFKREETEKAVVDEESEVLTECPVCDADIGPGDSFCSNCGEELDPHRGPNAEPEVEPTPQPSPEPTPEPDVVADHVTFEVDGVQVTDEEGNVMRYSDGDTVGKRIRLAAFDAGASQEDVQYIHRSHIKLVRDDDDESFYVVNHDNKEQERKNEVRINGEQLAIGERKKISDEDRVELSGVATATVKIPSR